MYQWRKVNFTVTLFEGDDTKAYSGPLFLGNTNRVVRIS